MISGSGVKSSVAVSSIINSIRQVQEWVWVGLVSMELSKSSKSAGRHVCKSPPPVDVDKMLHCDTLIIQE